MKKIRAENQKYNHSYFWDQRCKKFDHTGWNDEVIYKYDQPLRLRVIKKRINNIQGSIKNKKILDVGCGVGDFSIMFAKMGADITSIDISEEAIKKAKKRSEEEHIPCNLLVTSIKDMEFSPQSFDIITSITVLQHIPDEELSLSIQKMIDSLKIGGYIYILETAPTTTDQSMIDSEYQYFHTKKEWIELFENAGAKLYFEMTQPSFGLYLIQHCNNIAKRVYHKNTFRGSIERDITTKNQIPLIECDKLFKARSLVEKIILFFSKPFDYYMPFFSAEFGNITKIMVFKRLK